LAGSNGRTRRPDLERVASIRNFSRIFGPPRAPASSPNGTNGTRSRKRAEHGSPPAADDVQRGVGMGYQVIEDYMRQGEQFARLFYGSTGAPPPAPPRGGTAPDGADVRATAGRMAQVAADWVAAWMELMQTATGGGVPERGPARAGVPPFDIQPDREPPAAAPPRNGHSVEKAASSSPRPASRPAPVTLEISSRRPVEVSVDLTPGSAPGPLLAHDLRAVDSGRRRIGGVVVEEVSAGEHHQGFVVRIQVDDDQPPGVYAGLVVDPRTNTPRGSLSVRVRAAAQRTPRRKTKR
jgi:hypothetical protein